MLLNLLIMVELLYKLIKKDTLVHVEQLMKYNQIFLKNKKIIY